MRDPAPIPQDLKHVSCDRAIDVQYWTNRFSTSRAMLEEAVDKVGNNVAAVADYLAQRSV